LEASPSWIRSDELIISKWEIRYVGYVRPLYYTAYTVREAVAEAEAEAVPDAAQCSEAGKERWAVYISLVLAPEGAVRGGGLFLEPHRRPTGLFPASPLAFASSSCSSLSCLSLCSLLQSRCWAASLSDGDWVFKNRARGFTLARLELVFEITLKTIINK